MTMLENKEIEVQFSDVDKVIRVAPRYQWDYGVTINLSGLVADLPVYFHCAFEKQVSPAIIVATQVVDGVYSAVIPNELFMQPNSIRCYVYIGDDDSGSTVFEVRVPIIRRARPGDYVYYPSDNILNVTDVLYEINNMRTEMDNKVDVQQGVEQANQLLYVDNEGNVSRLVLSSDLSITGNKLHVVGGTGGSSAGPGIVSIDIMEV